MNNPSLLTPLPQQGFYEFNFTTLYNPGILVCERSKLDPQNLPDAKKGIFIPVVTQKADYNFDIYIGCSGLESDEHPLVNRLHRVCNRDCGLQIAGKWDKAVLLFDWQDDIEDCVQFKKGFDLQEKLTFVNGIMDNEAYYLKTEFANRFRKDLNLKVDGQQIRSFVLFRPDFSRYEYYFIVVSELVRMIIDGKI